jgi:signal transduction histidine kinase/ActR/RegA family two-component response regulator
MINVAALHYAFLSHSPIPEGIPMSQRLAQAITALCAAGALGAINRYQTDRYQRELRARNEDLDKANDVLESEVVRRTQDLVAARDLALSASRVKSEILVNMSHELRTPMNAILGNSDILLDSPLDARQRECVDEVQLSGRTLLGLIDDMLEYSDLDMGGMKLDEQVTDIRSLLNSTITSFSAIAKAKSLPIDIEVAADVPPLVIVDGNRWRRILVNLVGNAVKFTERGAVRVSLDSFDLTTDSLRLRCRVQDTGIGIPRDRLEHIFEMFGQVDSSLKRRMTGAGLGLALSKSLVERMGGTLVVASEPGEGSTFTFDVPAKVSKEKPVFKFESTNPRPANQAPSTSSESRSNSSPCRILLAEDNIINQKVALAMLKKLGYEADLAANGAQAVEATEKERYDVILMDVQMPEMDGLEATRTILARKEAANRPVIIGFTAHILASDKEQCYAAGMVDIVPKPTELNVLKDALLRAMSKAA